MTTELSSTKRSAWVSAGAVQLNGANLIATLCNHLLNRRPLQGFASSKLLHIMDQVTDLAGRTFNRLQYRNRTTMSGDRDPLPAGNLFKQLGQVRFGFIDTDLTHSTPPDIKQTRLRPV